jgi:hypothetical protein
MKTAFRTDDFIVRTNTVQSRGVFLSCYKTPTLSDICTTIPKTMGKIFNITTLPEKFKFTGKLPIAMQNQVSYNFMALRSWVGPQ